MILDIAEPNVIKAIKLYHHPTIPQFHVTRKPSAVITVTSQTPLFSSGAACVNSFQLALKTRAFFPCDRAPTEYEIRTRESYGKIQGSAHLYVNRCIGHSFLTKFCWILLFVWSWVEIKGQIISSLNKMKHYYV